MGEICRRNHEMCIRDRDTMSGLVPLASVGHALGIPTPMMDAFVNIASAVCGRDFWKEGRTAEKLGMAGKTLEEIQEMVR